MEGLALQPNVSAEQAYSNKINRMIRSMIYETRLRLLAPFTKDDAKPIGEDAAIELELGSIVKSLERKHGKIFEKEGEEVATSMLSRINSSSEKAVVSSIEKLSGGVSVRPDFIKGELKQALRASTVRNVDLISSIESQYYTRVNEIVMQSILPGGEGAAGIRKGLEKLGQQTVNRGVNIARDQTKKAYTALNALRMEQAGLDKFEWLHSRGGKTPRPLHVSYDRKIFSISDPPIIDERTGERGLPGQLIHCGCTMRPVITFNRGEPD